jgi:hydrogenase expression/formation protein HypD
MTIEQVKQELKDYHGRPIKIMEVCGTHTASIFKNGIRSLLSPNIQLISGPGCPVCVTSSAYIDRLVEYALKEDYCILTFGDMMKVKGSSISLTEAKAKGAKVQILYSPLTAVKIALEHRESNYIFAAVGFETTAPIYALLVEAIKEQQIKNLQLMTSIKTILPALAFLCDKKEDIDAFLCPGHVSAITGSSIYQELSMQYQKPFVIAGFEGEHILTAVYEILQQLKHNRPSVKNFYSSVVTEEGNERATQLIDRYFEPVSEYWRGNPWKDSSRRMPVVSKGMYADGCDRTLYGFHGGGLWDLV